MAEAALAPISKPRLSLYLTDLPRASLELSLLPLAIPALRNLPKGDGHPVMVLPGLITSDFSTTLLRRFLKRKGYDVHAWELGRNYGPRSVGEMGEKIDARVADIYQATGRKVSLVGWSLGGMISRQVSQRMPDCIRQVITLGSPFTGDIHATHATKIYERISGDRYDQERLARRLKEEARPVPVPSTAIYSRLDGITAWENCLEEEEDHQTENVQVLGSHWGMSVNPAIFYVIADRLAQPQDEWRRFAPTAPAKWFFPMNTNRD